MTRWEDVDLVERYWTIPVANVKGPMGKKQGHRVYLSDFSMRQFQALKALTGTSPFCFPARNRKEDTHIDLKTVSKQVGDRQIQFKTRKDLSAPTTTHWCSRAAATATGHRTTCGAPAPP